MFLRANSTMTYCQKNKNLFKQGYKFYRVNAKGLQATTMEAGNVYLMTAAYF